MKIADGELRQLLTYDIKMPSQAVHELVADSKQTGRSLLQTVLVSKQVDESVLGRVQAKRLGVPYVALEDEPIPLKTLELLPHQIAAKYQVACFDQTPTSIKLAMSDPRDEKARKAVKDYLPKKTIRRYQATSRGLAQAIHKYPKSGAPIHFSTRDMMTTILEQAITAGSHDVHFEPHDSELVVKLRLGKDLRTVSTLPLQRLHGLISWCKLQTNNDVADTQQVAHGSFRVLLHGAIHKVMFSSIPVTGGQKMVLKLLPPGSTIPDLKLIGYSANQIDALEQLIADGRGLVIIAGDSNSLAAVTRAKLATMAAQQPHVSVTCVDEGPSYLLPLCTQVEVGAQLSFADAITNSIAENPSAIVTSRLGTAKTAEQLMDFALSQHLVLTGLYAANMSSVITHLQRYPVLPALLAASLRLLVVQHQIKKLCSRCRVPFEPKGPLKQALLKQFKLAEHATLYRGGPSCATCRSGSLGTVMAADWLAVDDDLQQLLATKADNKRMSDYIIATSDFNEVLGKLASDGEISIDEATRLAL